MKNYKDLIVWQKSMDLVVNVYELTRTFPKYESVALSEQMRKSAISVPSNIAEGYNRFSDKELLKFLYIARGSITELETQILIAKRLSYSNEEKIQYSLAQSEEVCRLLNSFISSIKQ